MKDYMKLELLMFFLIFFSLNVKGFINFSQGDCIYSSIDNSTCKVVGVYSNSIENVTILPYVSYNGDDYEVTTIDYGAFSNYPKVKSVNLPTTVKTIAFSAFNSQEGKNLKLEKINLDNVEVIEASAFAYCRYLSDIGSLKSLKELGNNSFQSTAITEIELPGTLENLNVGAFSGCEDLKNLILNEGIKKIEGTFCNSLKNILIPSSVTYMDTRVTESSMLQSLKFVDGLEPLTVSQLGSFHVVAPDMEDLYIGRNISSPNSDTFYAMKNASKLEFGPFVNTFPDWSFQEFNNLKSIFLGPSITAVANGAFRNCINLENIEFGPNIEEIGLQSFFSCGVKNIIFPENIKSIGNSAFRFCESLNHIELGNGVEKIEYKAFESCTNVEELIIPINVSYVGFDAFYGMKSLSSLIIEDTNDILEITTYSDSSYDYGYAKERALFGASNLNVAYIGRNFTTSFPTAGIFKSVNTLEKIIIGNMVTELPDYALIVGYNEPGYSEECNLKEVYLGENLQKLGYGSIRFNPSYEGSSYIISYNTIPPEWQPNSNGYYDSFSSNVNVYVPNISIQDYSKANVWSTFKDGRLHSIDNEDTEQIVLNLESAELKIGETVQLEATVLPEDATDKSLTWNSSNPNIAGVSAEGLVTAVSAGTAIISVSCGEASASCEVKVINDAGIESLLANPDSKISIFSTEGILINKDCKIEELKTLNKGIYIIVSGKDIYKISI